jgi:hypothetical protein
VVALALLGFLYRAFLTVPGDLWARLIMAPADLAYPRGSLGFWAQAATADPGFVKHFVLVTFWLGAVLGLAVLARRAGRWTDPFSGLVAGAVGGLMASATLACLMPVLDALPRGLFALLQQAVGTSPAASAPWVWTPLWMLLAILFWTLQGAVGGLLLRLTGEWGLRVIAGAGWPFAALFRLCGLGKAAAFFAME